MAGLPGSDRSSTLPTSRSELLRARPVSLINGPGGLYRDDRASERSSQASPLPAPRSSSLLRVHRSANKGARADRTSPTLLGLSLPKDENEDWNIADEDLPEIADEIPHELDHDDVEEDRNSSVAPSTVQHKAAATAPINTVHGETSRSNSSFIPRSSSQATVTKNAASQLPRASPIPSKIPTSRSVSGISDTPSSRSISSRLPRLGLKPSTRYQSTTSGGIRSVSGATDKSTGSTLSSVYSGISSGAPPSLGTLPSGNNTMEDEIQAELARLGNPQPYMRYYSPPRSKMI